MIRLDGFYDMTQRRILHVPGICDGKVIVPQAVQRPTRLTQIDVHDFDGGWIDGPQRPSRVNPPPAQVIVHGFLHVRWDVGREGHGKAHDQIHGDAQPVQLVRGIQRIASAAGMPHEYHRTMGRVGLAASEQMAAGPAIPNATEILRPDSSAAQLATQPSEAPAKDDAVAAK